MTSQSTARNPTRTSNLMDEDGRAAVGGGGLDLRQVGAAGSDALGGLAKSGDLVGLQIELDDLFDTVTPQTGGKTDEHVRDPVLAGGPDARRKDLARVSHDGVDHLGHRRRRG